MKSKFKGGRGIQIAYIILSVFFLICEMYFALLVTTYGNGDIAGSFAKTVVVLLFIVLYYIGVNWAKWLITTFLLLYSIACAISGIENNKTGFYALASFYFFYFVIFIFLKKERNQNQ